MKIKYLFLFIPFVLTLTACKTSKDSSNIDSYNHNRKIETINNEEVSCSRVFTIHDSGAMSASNWICAPTKVICLKTD